MRFEIKKKRMCIGEARYTFFFLGGAIIFLMRFDWFYDIASILGP